MRFEELLEILYEDNHLLVIDKPAGWPSAHSDDSLHSIAKAYLKEKYQKPGNVYLGVVHRIDKPVSGVLLFARTSKAAARLSEQFRHDLVEKIYWAIVEGNSKPARGYGWACGDSATFEDYLWHDDNEHNVKVVLQGAPGAKHARLRSIVKSIYDTQALLELHPQTGRKHQLRVQLSSRGTPIYGDHKYGSDNSFGSAIALHARQLTVLHPITSEPMTFTAELPKLWRGHFAHLLAGFVK